MSLNTGESARTIAELPANRDLTGLGEARFRLVRAPRHEFDAA